MHEMHLNIRTHTHTQHSSIIILLCTLCDFDRVDCKIDCCSANGLLLLLLSSSSYIHAHSRNEWCFLCIKLEQAKDREWKSKRERERASNTSWHCAAFTTYCLTVTISQSLYHLMHKKSHNLTPDSRNNGWICERRCNANKLLATSLLATQQLFIHFGYHSNIHSHSLSFLLIADFRCFLSHFSRLSSV